MISTRRLGWTSLALLALAGCNEPVATTPATPPAAPAPAAPASDAPKGANEIKSLPVEPDKKAADATDPAKLSADEVAEIKKLPADDQPIALAQVSCPVSDSHLGEMGAPIKQVVDGKTVFLCCEKCEKPLKADPAKYLAKLKK